MTPIEIKAALMVAGVSGREMAKRLGVTDQAVSNVIYGRTTSMRVRKAIAEALSKPVNALWPSAGLVKKVEN